MLRRAGLCGLLTAAFGATLGIGSGPAGGATARQSPPEVAIGQVRQSWNRVEVDYGLADANAAKLEVDDPDGQPQLVDLQSGVSGTLVWDRKFARVHAPLGQYRLTVTGQGPGGENDATRLVTLGLLYTHRPTQSRNEIRVRYELAEDAQLELVLKPQRGAGIVVERRNGHRGPGHITWDLRRNGKRVAPGRYQLQLVATAGATTARATLGGAG